MIGALKGHVRPSGTFLPKRRIAIGDIHGQIQLLIKLMTKIQFNPEEDELIFLGDYIDRGMNAQDEMDTVNYLIDLVAKNSGKVVLLRGNHEQMAIDAISNPKYENLKLWMHNGLGGKLKWAFSDMHMLYHFCRALPLTYETENNLFVHAGALNGKPVREQDTYYLLWDRDTNNLGYNGKQLIVGHTPMEEVVITPDVVYVDTGAYHTGVLSAYDTLNGTVYSSSR